jgi:uncharacterized OsmC-like protein
MNIHIPGYPAGDTVSQDAMHNLVNSLMACVTASVAARAEAQKINIKNMDISVKGDMNLEKFLGGCADLNEWYQQIQITMDVSSDADEEILEDILRSSQHAVLAGVRSAIEWRSRPV